MTDFDINPQPNIDLTVANKTLDELRSEWAMIPEQRRNAALQLSSRFANDVKELLLGAELIEKYLETGDLENNDSIENRPNEVDTAL